MAVEKVVTTSRRSRHAENGNISLSAVEQRVYTVEQVASNLGSQMDVRINTMAESINRRIDRLSESLEKKSTPQWQTMFAGVAVLLTVLGMVGTIVYVLIQSQLNANAQSTKEVAATVAQVTTMIRTDYITIREAQGWREDDRDRLERVSNSLMLLRQDAILRPEYSVMQTAQNDQLSQLMQNNVQAYPIGDILKDIQNRLSAIERAGVMRLVPNAPAVVP